MNIRPLSDWVLIELEPEKETSRGGIIRVGPQPIRIAKVLRVGPGKWWLNKDGSRHTFWETRVKSGDRIAFCMAVLQTLQGKAIVHSVGENMGLIRETDILFAVNGDVEVSA